MWAKHALRVPGKVVTFDDIACNASGPVDARNDDEKLFYENASGDDDDDDASGGDDDDD